MIPTMNDEIIEHLPYLLSFARMIARDRTLADDLVQETVLRALAHADQFRPGTHLKAWLSTILRNAFFDEKRSQKRLAQLTDAFATAPNSTGGEQEARCVMRDFVRLFPSLPAVQSDALALVGAGGHCYAEAARIAGCCIGTMKSRTSRARLRLHHLLDGGARIAVSDSHPDDAGFNEPLRRRVA
jgi:RNA polymerase sigma-70 factor, ECF subfamily